MILITNDDGIRTKGIRSLIEVLSSIDEIYVVAPDRERSAVGMSITLRQPLRAEKIADRQFAVDGTPVDCVDLALAALLPEKPKLVVSGINHGQNLGHDLHFSGTLAAARKASLLGVPAIAVSLLFGETDHYETAAEITLKLAKKLISQLISDRSYFLPLLNVNVPNVPLEQIKGIRTTRQDRGSYTAEAIERRDRYDRRYYWIGGERAKTDSKADTDLYAAENGFVSVTPLTTDQTNFNSFEITHRWLDEAEN